MYIISDAEKLTREAQNSLLIVLEEPPRGVNIMLLSDGADKLLTTVRSRAQLVTLPRLSDGELEDELIRRSGEAARLCRTDRALLSQIVRAADGALGRALEALDPANTAELKARRETALSLLSAMGKGVPYSELYAATGSLPTKRPELSRALEDLTDALRDMIAARQTGGVRLRFFRDSGEALEMAERIGPRRLIPLYDLVLEIYGENTKNANLTALLAVMAARIKAIQ